MTTRLRHARRHLGAKAAALAYRLQDHPDRAPRSVTSLSSWRLAPSLQSQIEILACLARVLRGEDGPAFRYLDLSVAHLAEDERDVILATPDDDPHRLAAHPPRLPRVVPHRYGAWVHVSYEIHDDHDELRRLQSVGYPSFAAVLAFASRRGCQWINFDADAEDIPELPLYDERPVPVDTTFRSRRRRLGSHHLPSRDIALLGLRRLRLAISQR